MTVVVKNANCMFTRHTRARKFPKWCPQIDFVAAYIIPLDIWYILPAPVTTRLPYVSPFPHSARATNARPT